MDPPAHLQEHLEALGAAGGNGQVKVVAPNTIDNGWGANILVEEGRKRRVCVCLVGEGRRRGEAVNDQLTSTQQYFRQLLLPARQLATPSPSFPTIHTTSERHQLIKLELRVCSCKKNHQLLSSNLPAVRIYRLATKPLMKWSSLVPRLLFATKNAVWEWD